jgi:hypothetical protein
VDSFEAFPAALPVALDVDPAHSVLFAPYCGGVAREAWLELALDLLPVRRLDGRRQLRPAGSHPFELSWQPVEAPQELVACALNFPATPGLNYTFTLPAHQLVSWLMDLLEAQALRGEADLPESFWRWLLLGESPAPSAA